MCLCESAMAFQLYSKSIEVPRHAMARFVGKIVANQSDDIQSSICVDRILISEKCLYA